MRRYLFRLGLSLFSLGLLAGTTMRQWPGDRSYPVRLLNYLTPWLSLVLIPTLVAAGLMRMQRVLWLVIAIPTMLISLPLLPLFLPRLGAVPATRLPFKVMSYSVCSDNRNSPAILQVIREARPDLLLLQEIKPEMAEALNDGLHDLYPAGEFQSTYAPEVKQMIISRYPLTPLGVDPEGGLVQKVKLETPGGSITVWNVHTDRPQYWAGHYRELSALAREISAVSGPLIVGGDFNAMDLSETYRLVARYLRNAHREAGWGFGFTFPAPSFDFECRPEETSIPIKWPLVRIDHIFYSDHLYAHRAGTLTTSGGSEHLPVVAELALRH